MKREKYFEGDLERLWLIRHCERSSRIGKLRRFLKESGIHLVASYRFQQYAHYVRERCPVLGVPLLVVSTLVYRAMMKLCMSSFECVFGPGLFIAHAVCLFVGGTIGRNCTLHQCVTIGWGYTDGKVGTPEIGDNVWIGPNAILTGRIKVGSNATIAPGSVVSRDVPEGALVAGNPARVVSLNYQNGNLSKWTHESVMDRDVHR